MNTHSFDAAVHGNFDLSYTLETLRHYLPTQAPLKDFVHHNTLHAFQEQNFHEACARASKIFGYKTTLSLEEFRILYEHKRIAKDVLHDVIARKKGANEVDLWMKRLLLCAYNFSIEKRIGNLRSHWKTAYHFDMNSRVHPKMFRLLNNYLDQGIAAWPFPQHDLSFWHAIQKLEANSYTSFFRTKKASKFIQQNEPDLLPLLQRLVGDENLYAHYIFDQQFTHPGWSGMVAMVEKQPNSLLDSRKINLIEMIALELLFEIDALDHHFKENWKPLNDALEMEPTPIFSPTQAHEMDSVLQLWQEAFEWTYYDEVLAGLSVSSQQTPTQESPSFQAFFCIDDRECSIRQHLEYQDPQCETYGTPGHFGLECFYQPENGKFYTKVCPPPVHPTHLIKESNRKDKRKTDAHFGNNSHSLFGGFLIAQTLGFWSALKLAWDIFKPSPNPATASSFKHMDKRSNLTVECDGTEPSVDGLQVGYTVEEMSKVVEGVLRSTGLVSGFAPIIYIIGHGSSSVNNTHYAGYDCGACSGRPGSVNARAFSTMANDPRVRNLLRQQGIRIPESTQFLGGLHDTSRDEVEFYDEKGFTGINQSLHELHLPTFNRALRQNAKERARRFELIDIHDTAEKVHEKVKIRTVSLFEPRPELNHATNTLCIVGRRDLTRRVFLDRRAFLNSYDYRLDPQGKLLEGILNAAAPVCGGINLEYYFSRVDNQRLGAGTKLPHNVMGLIGVANGVEGDLRTGLPKQMIEVHDPIRLMLIVEHDPVVVLEALTRNPSTYEWIGNEWIRLAVIHPLTRVVHVFTNGVFEVYTPLTSKLVKIIDLEKIIEESSENLPVFHLN